LPRKGAKRGDACLPASVPACPAPAPACPCPALPACLQIASHLRYTKQNDLILRRQSSSGGCAGCCGRRCSKGCCRKMRSFCSASKRLVVPSCDQCRARTTVETNTGRGGEPRNHYVETSRSGVIILRVTRHESQCTSRSAWAVHHRAHTRQLHYTQRYLHHRAHTRQLHYTQRYLLLTTTRQLHYTQRYLLLTTLRSLRIVGTTLRSLRIVGP